MVAQDQVYNLRLTMSGQGLPAGNESGYSLLDEQGITTSEFQQQVSYQRALEGELAKTLKALDGVNAAVVHIALPKDEVFATDEGKPTASVLLDLAPGTKLVRGAGAGGHPPGLLQHREDGPGRRHRRRLRPARSCPRPGEGVDRAPPATRRPQPSRSTRPGWPPTRSRSSTRSSVRATPSSPCGPT